MPKTRVAVYDPKLAAERKLFGTAGSPTLGPDDQDLIDKLAAQTKGLVRQIVEEKLELARQRAESPFTQPSTP